MTTYRLAPHTRHGVEPPRLDADQRRVVDHAGGPLLVLAGPGTGKTTTLVEAIVRRIEQGADPASVLALTFSRKAAEQLRDRVAARLGRTVGALPCATFHSFAYGLVRRYTPDDLYDGPLRLLSAPESDVVVGELLRDTPESVQWPDSLRRAVGTRGFAREVAALLDRARERGLGPEDLVALGEAEGQPAWVAAGRFLASYLEVLDPQGLLDYAGLMQRAVLVAETHRDELRAGYRHVFVDEYQDTDPAQVALLQHLAGDGRDLVVVGDPHQSIYAFRGADVRGILDFPDQFPQATGEPAPVVVLRTTRRFGAGVLGPAQRVAARIGLGGSIDAASREAFLRPTVDPSVAEPGSVQVLTFDTARAETDHIADLLRRAHLEDDVGWQQMAVLVRSGSGSIPSLRRGLTAAGVPVEVAGDETPLAREPAVAPLLQALELVAALDRPDGVDTSTVATVLSGPLGGVDAGGLRTLARALRRRERARVGEGGAMRPSDVLVRDAVLGVDDWDGLDEPAGALVAARGLTALLRQARARLEADATVEEVLWEIWAGTAWPDRLRRATERGGTAARLAHRDLDAVCALFETAARAEEHRGHTRVASFLDLLRAQQIPADTLADRGIRGDAVRLLTAHRAKGLEWDLVVLAEVQEGRWPDVRRRQTLLQADRLGRVYDGVPTTVAGASTRELMAEERRLFYVACTRARRRLVVTAVRSADAEGDQPSRFLDELVPPDPQPAPAGFGAVRDHVRRGRQRPLSLGGLVAELRRTTADGAASPALRRAAAERLVSLADERIGSRALVPAADPAHWWGTRGISRTERPLRPADEPISISPSALQSLVDCPVRWFLEREAKGAPRSSSAQGFGLIIHALADRVAMAEIGSEGQPVEEVVEELLSHLDRVWDRLDFRTPWSSVKEREAARTSLENFLIEHRRSPRRLLATEQPVEASVTLPDGETVRLRGYADRLELDDEGRVVVVDLKTSKTKPTQQQVVEHAQLGLYSLAVDHGGVDDLLAEQGLAVPGRSGGAELWQLRAGTSAGASVQRQEPHPPDGGPRPVEVQLMQAVRTLRGEEFVARPSEACRQCRFRGMCPAHQSETVLS